QWERQADYSPHDPAYDASFAALPNLVVIDGGRGQLSAGLGALRAFRERGVAVVSLAKRIEELFVPGTRTPIVLDHSTPELQLLQRVRDEAHRFAITHHRARRDRAMTRSLLDELPGVGPARKRARLEHLVVITGFSGAGKSTAMNVFEDAGYFCVDNLPPELIRSLVEVFAQGGSKVERAAVVSDVRGGVHFEALRAVVDDLDALGVSHHVLFLEADEQTLVTRYKETRRRHPLAPEGSVAAGIGSERSLLAPLRDRADLVIDTTGMAAAALRGKIAEEFLPLAATTKMALTFMSFGFKHGP